MKAHLGNAVLALVFSLLIWCAVGAQMSTRDTTRIDFVIDVPTGVVASCEGRSATGESLVLQAAVSVTVRGPKEKVNRLGLARIRGRLPLGALDPKAFEGFLAAGGMTIDVEDYVVAGDALEVIETQPARLRLELQRVLTTERWVAPGPIAGAPAPGRRRGEVRVSPRRVVVRGPAQVLARDPEQPFVTEGIDLAGASESFTVERAVRCPEGVVAQRKVQVHVEILAELAVREIKFNVRLLEKTSSEDEALPSRKFRIEAPRGWSAKLPIRGPAAALDALETQLQRNRLLPFQAGKLPVAYVSAEGLRAMNPQGQPETKLTIEVSGLPAGCELAERRELDVVLVAE